MPYTRSLELVDKMKEDLDLLVESVGHVHKVFSTKAKARTYRNKLRVAILSAVDFDLDKYATLKLDYQLQLRGTKIIAVRVRGKRDGTRVTIPCPDTTLGIIDVIRSNVGFSVEFLRWKQPKDWVAIADPWLLRHNYECVLDQNKTMTFEQRERDES